MSRSRCRGHCVPGSGKYMLELVLREAECQNEREVKTSHNQGSQRVLLVFLIPWVACTTTRYDSLTVCHIQANHSTRATHTQSSCGRRLSRKQPHSSTVLCTVLTDSHSSGLPNNATPAIQCNMQETCHHLIMHTARLCRTGHESRVQHHG